MEFGARPASSLQELTPAPDVKFVEANGVRFAYVEEGTGPLVLLFHGYPETARSWGAVQKKIAAAGYRVVAPYLRGYPPSGFAADGDYSVATLGKDVVALIDALGAPNAIIVGHDWGAAAVYSAAANDTSGKITKLVAVAIPQSRAFAGDPSAFMEAPHFIYYQFPWAERLLWSSDFAHVDRIYRTWSPGYEPPPEVLADIKASLRVPGATASTLGYYWALFKADPKAQEEAAAKTIGIPTLVIAGRDDQPASLARFDKARSAFTGPYQFVVLDNVGHFPQLEAADRTADAIIAFLGPAPAAPPAP
jgi:pimeloyl-ACP methyl ester carboxylesterase